MSTALSHSLARPRIGLVEVAALANQSNLSHSDTQSTKQISHLWLVEATKKSSRMIAPYARIDLG